MGIARSAGRAFARVAPASWRPKRKPEWHENNDRITNLHVVKGKEKYDLLVDSKSDNEHNVYVAARNEKTQKTKYHYAESIGNYSRVDLGDPKTKTQSTPQPKGHGYSGFDSVVEHLKSQGFDVHGLNKAPTGSTPVLKGKMVHPGSRHNSTFDQNRYENYVALHSKTDEHKKNPPPPSSPSSGPSSGPSGVTNPSGMPKPSSGGSTHSQEDLLKWAKRLKDDYKKPPTVPNSGHTPGSPPSRSEAASAWAAAMTIATGSATKPAQNKGSDLSNRTTVRTRRRGNQGATSKPSQNKSGARSIQDSFDESGFSSNVRDYLNPAQKTLKKEPVSQSSPRTLQDNFDDAGFELNVRNYLNPAQLPQNEISAKSKSTRAVKPPKEPTVKKNAPVPVELPANAVELPTGKDHLDYIRGLVQESKDKAWRAGVAKDNLRGSQNPTILDPETVKKLKNVETPGFDDLDFETASLTPEKLQELDNSVQARAIGESNRAAVASGKGMSSGNAIDDVHRYLVLKGQGDDRIEGFQAIADRLEALGDPNLSKVIVRLRTSQDNLASQREALANPGTKEEKANARKKADALALGLRKAVDPTGVVDSSQIRNPKTGKPEPQVLPLEISTGAGNDIKEAINQGTGQFNKNVVNTHGIGLNKLVVPTNLQNHDGSFRDYTTENIPHYTAQLGRGVSDEYQSEQYFRDLAPDAEPSVPTTPIDDLHHRIASPLAKLAGLQAANSSKVDKNPNATSDRFAPATPGMIVQSTDSEGKTVSDKPVRNTEEMVKARLHEMEKSVRSSEGDLYDSIRKNLAGTFNQEDADYLAKLGTKKRARLTEKMVEQQLNDTVRRHAIDFANPEQNTSGETNIFTANGGVDPRDLIALADHYGSTGHKNPMTKAMEHLLYGDPAAQTIIQQINAYDKSSLENQFSIHQAGLAENPEDPAAQNAAAGVFNHMERQGLDTGGVGRGVSAEDQYAAAHPGIQEELDRKAREFAEFAAPPVVEQFVQTEPVPVDIPSVPVKGRLSRTNTKKAVNQNLIDHQIIQGSQDIPDPDRTSIESWKMEDGVTYGDFKVIRIDPDDNVILDGGPTYGVFKLPAGEFLQLPKEAAQAAPEPPPQEDIGNRVENYFNPRSVGDYFEQSQFDMDVRDRLNPPQSAQESARIALNAPTVAAPSQAQEPQAPPPPTKMTKAQRKEAERAEKLAASQGNQDKVKRPGRTLNAEAADTTVVLRGFASGKIPMIRAYSQVSKFNQKNGEWDGSFNHPYFNSFIYTKGEGGVTPGDAHKAAVENGFIPAGTTMSEFWEFLNGDIPTYNNWGKTLKDEFSGKTGGRKTRKDAIYRDESSTDKDGNYVPF